jgi:hypothetical protein
MKRVGFLPGIVAGVLLGGAVTAFATTRTYQYTGTVKDVGSTQLSVDKAGEVWDFAVNGDTKGADVKSGEKVTVTYRMLATKIERK